MCFFKWPNDSVPSDLGSPSEVEAFGEVESACQTHGIVGKMGDRGFLGVLRELLWIYLLTREVRLTGLSASERLAVVNFQHDTSCLSRCSHFESASRALMYIFVDCEKFV